MNTLQRLTIGAAMMAMVIGANAQQIDWSKVDTALGKTAAVAGEVHRYGFPLRSAGHGRRRHHQALSCAGWLGGIHSGGR